LDLFILTSENPLFEDEFYKV